MNVDRRDMACSAMRYANWGREEEVIVYVCSLWRVLIVIVYV